jgi:FkbM family methyltransferase
MPCAIDHPWRRGYAGCLAGSAALGKDRRNVGARLRLDRIEGHTFIGSWLGPASVVLDCGMNQGLFARRLAARRGCRIIGVEANPALARQVRDELGFECHNLALWDRRGVVRFQVDPAYPVASTIVSDDAEGPNVIDVPATTLEDLLTELGSPRLDLLKLDIESAELGVLSTTPLGILQAIPQITVEFHAFVHPHQRADVLACIGRLREAGFWALDFSTVLMNVLFVNQRLRPLSAADKTHFLGAKYVSGALRRLTGINP